MQCTQALLPQGPIPVKPVVELFQRLSPQRVCPVSSLLPDLDEARLPQDPQVARDTGTSDGEKCSELTCGRGPAAQRVDHGSPAGVRQRMQYSVHRECVADWVLTRLDTYLASLPVGRSMQMRRGQDPRRIWSS